MYNQPHFRYLEGAGPELSSPGEKEEGLGHQSTPDSARHLGDSVLPCVFAFRPGGGEGTLIRAQMSGG